MQKQAVLAFIFNASRTHLLLVQRTDIPVWVPPGGGVDEGETIEEAIKREALEETGYQIAIIRQFASYSPLYRWMHPTHCFEARILAGNSSTSSETQAVRFFPLTKLPRLFPPFYNALLQDALTADGGIVQKPFPGLSIWNMARMAILHPILVFRFLVKNFISSSGDR